MADDYSLKLAASMTMPRLVEQLDQVTRTFTGSIELIDTTDGVRNAVKKLRKYTELSLDCEGVRLGRDGKMMLLQLGAKGDTVYLFDVLKLGKALFELGVKDILESSIIVKYVFDCRQDSVSLWLEYQVKLSNVFDMQLLEYLCRKKAGTSFRRPTKRWHYRLPVIRGMNDTVSKYVSLYNLGFGSLPFSAIKDAGHNLINTEQTIWRYRPISNGLKIYAALDIVMTWAIVDGLQRYEKLEGVTRERIKIASERYAAVRRDVGHIDKIFIHTSLLLSYIIPEVSGGHIVPFPTCDRKCSGCQREMPSQDFRTNLCIDCNEIQRVSVHRR
ncbi:uncharacterized protein LOC130622199 [Hydractinia symbiolongicarpus]|uniref:uncharacterized protein LOC130622199 n=1 Tax=Hydractinia symbiolongicarpus TaxID=13093 RepID=UPI00254C0986|nr:uncharacterized protein LOC130622199 [Hydractinia symbiolongicarpus]XP_057293617.1 uncharacterized protein LOC130622199 [Hydractinia symbiolongicarpus]XP_057293618.1 uncharacterized protein LOC130622199 [Hydractinia symbiolongicarpus]